MKIVVLLTLLSLAAIFLTSCTAKYGRLPSGARLERVKRSPNYRDGSFQNLEPTQMMQGGFFSWISDSWSAKNKRPSSPLPVVKTDLSHLPESDFVIWFGHSSYLLQIDGVRFLIDPVFVTGSPVWFANQSFEMTYRYSPAEMPEIDYLVISHDHWDHLDYETVTQLRKKTKKVLCPLGVGEHFARWEFPQEQLIELDWNESATFENGTLYCTPQRHFSGRLLRRNRTLWASYVIESHEKRIFIGGDGGYGIHFKQIGEQFGDFDLAILENGQYNKAWAYIHTLPEQLLSEVSDLKAKQVLTVHHSKFALSIHPWDEPLQNAKSLAETARVLMPQMGELLLLDL